MEQRRGLGVQLALHQPLALLGEDHLGAPLGQRAGRGDTEQPAADHHRAQARHGGHGRGQRQAVVHGAERVDPVGEFPAGRPGDRSPGGTGRLEQPAQRRQHRVGARGQHQHVVLLRTAVVAVHRPVGAVDAYRPHPAPQHGAGRREGGHLRRVPARQYLGEQYPVVRDVRLLAEYGDVRGPALAEAPCEPQAREPAADHHHTLLLRGHGTRVRGRCFPSASRLLPERNAHLSAGADGR